MLFKVTHPCHLLYIMKLDYHFYKGKVHSRRGLEGPEGEQIYNSTLPLILALDSGWSTPHHGHFILGKES